MTFNTRIYDNKSYHYCTLNSYEMPFFKDCTYKWGLLKFLCADFTSLNVMTSCSTHMAMNNWISFIWWLNSLLLCRYIFLVVSRSWGRKECRKEREGLINECEVTNRSEMFQSYYTIRWTYRGLMCYLLLKVTMDTGYKYLQICVYFKKKSVIRLLPGKKNERLM